MTGVDDRFDYGELREISLGMIGASIILVVVHTDREGAIRIISARKADRRERRLFHDYLEKALGRD
ncbi:MAG: BrnT family toxin [Minwuia sp.]|nr:BrnT family toxin [Minwuia sp.]